MPTVEFECASCHWTRTEPVEFEGLLPQKIVCAACRVMSPELRERVNEILAKNQAEHLERLAPLIGRDIEKRFHKAIKLHCSKTQQGLIMGEFRKILGIDRLEAATDGSSGER